MSTTTPPVSPVPPVPEPIPNPPGLPASPLATWAVTSLSAIVIEAINFSVISSHLANEIVGWGALVLPLVINAADALIRHGHALASRPRA